MTIRDLNVNDIFEWNGTLYRVTGEGTPDNPIVQAIASYWPNGRGADSVPTWVATDQKHNWNPYCEINVNFCKPTGPSVH